MAVETGIRAPANHVIFAFDSEAEGEVADLQVAEVVFYADTCFRIKDGTIADGPPGNSPLPVGPRKRKQISLSRNRQYSTVACTFSLRLTAAMLLIWPG